MKIAVLDYVIGNTDRHYGNFRTVGEESSPARERKILAYDHGLAFPEVMLRGYYGVFHENYTGGPISEDVMASLRAVHQGSYSASRDRLDACR